MPSKEARSAATKEDVIAAARPVFARDGFAKAALSEIVSAAGVTTGAIYHHFGDKQGLFIAVAESVEQEILYEVRKAATRANSNWDVLEASLIRSVEICAHPDIQRIVFRDAPTVVGMREWREIEIKYSFGLLKELLQNLISENQLKSKNIDLLAQVYLGALIEAAHVVASSKAKKQTLAEAKHLLLSMIRSWRR